LGATWYLARALSMDPDQVLQWKESKVATWVAVARDTDRSEALLRAVVTSYAVWDPKRVPELLEEHAPTTRADIKRALEQAERVSHMRLVAAPDDFGRIG